MSSSEITLKEFVCPIATCEQNSSLKTIVRTVKSSTNGIVAIVNEERSPIGIIHSHRLLSFLIERGLYGTSKPLEENISKFVNNECLLDYHDLISSALIFSAQQKIRELLSSLNQQNPSSSNQEYYLIVDENKQLLGTIDLHQILRFLLTETNHQSKKNLAKKSLLEEDLYRLLDQIPLPIILKSKEDRILHQNLFCYEHYQVPQGNIRLNALLDDLLPQSLTKELAINKEIGDSTLTNSPESPVIVSAKSVLSKIAVFDKLLLEKDDCNYIKLPLDFTKNIFLEPDSPLKQSYLLIGIQPVINFEYSYPQKELNSGEKNIFKLNRLKNEFLLNLGHDLKSPLTAIIGLSHLLKAEKLGQLNKRQVEYLNLIYRNGQKLMIIINDLLNMSRVAAVKSEINLETLDIKELCEEVYQQVLHKLELKQKIQEGSFYSPLKLPLNLDINPRLAKITADRICLTQILSQLLNQALNFSFCTGQVGIKVDDWNRWLAITVWDNGKAIPEARQTLLLEQSFDLNNDDISGNLEDDLGLIFTQKLAQIHGGDISFIAKVAQGNSFTVILPQNPNNFPENANNNLLGNALNSFHSHPENQWENNQKNTDNLVVLLVETLSSRIEYLNNKLTQLGYYPIIARSPEEVLYKAINFQPRKIIVSRELVNSWNQELISQLGNNNQTKNIPVLIMEEKEDISKKSDSNNQLILPLPLTIDSVMMAFPPVVTQNKQEIKFDKSLTILRLLISSELDNNYSKRDLALESIFRNRTFSCQHRLIEADSLEQANMLSRIWQIDAVILDGSNLTNPRNYLLSYQESGILASLPLITLDPKTTAAANQINGLSVFPCLLPSNERSIAELMQVIQIATGIK